MPKSTFGGQFLHPDLFSQASAYAFHICQNHPFIDGNKRTALASALVFLELNGIEVMDPRGELYELMMSVSAGTASKEQIAMTLSELAT
jgi:death-on-curing protein